VIPDRPTQPVAAGLVGERAADRFRLPGRPGTPGVGAGAGAHGRSGGGFAEVSGGPKVATGVGLVLYGARHEPLEDAADTGVFRGASSPDRSGVMRDLFQRMRDMF